MGDREYEATLEIISPSGEQVTLDAEGLFKAEEIGEYSFIYRVQADGQSLEETYIVNVEYSSENLFVPNASVSAVIENVDAKYVLQKGSNGVAVVASTGGEVRYANVVDLSALGKETPIIEFQPLTSSDGYLNIRTVIVTLTDIHDETNLVKIKWTLNIDSFVYTYLSVNAGGNGYYALRYPDGHVFKDKYGTNTGCSFYVDQYEPQALSNIRMDFENNAFYAYNGQYIPIIDSDDIKQVGDGYQWKGFTTGEVYVSVSLPDATNGGVIITSIAGQSLAGTKIVDETAPSIVINAEAEYLQQGMPEGVVGMEYPIPTAVSRDLLATNSKLLFRVEYENVESGEREEIPLENGVFIPKKQGTYKLVWTATDMVGNQGKIELPVTVNDTPNDITVDFSKEIADVFVGDKAYIPAIRANGGNGKLSYAVEWAFNGQKIDFTAPAFYRATEKGALTAKVVVTDYIGNVKTQNLTVEINTPELPVLKVLDVPSSVVKGAILTLPDFTAIDYNYEANENAYQAERKLFINEEEVDLTARTYTVTQEKGSVLTVRYVATGKNGDSEKIYFVQVIEPQYIGDYLIYDNSKVTCSLNDAYTEFVATEDFTVSMPNPVSVQDMILCFYVDENHMANGGTVSVWMTDSNDSSVQLKMTITQMDNGKMGIYLNENTEKTMPLTLKADGAVYFAFNSFAKQISDSQGKKILGVEYDTNGFEFEGFESGGAYIAFTVNNLSQMQEGENEEMLSSTFFRLNQVGNQRFVTMYFNGEAQTYVDRIAPQLSHSFSMSSKTVKLGDTIAVASAKAFDVLQNQATVTVTVESPTKVLYSNVAIDEDLFFTAEEYGYYSITYTVKSGVRTDKLPSYFIKVQDETPPTIQVNGKVQESCKVGKTLVLPKATIGDDSTDVEMLQFFVFVIEPNGRYIDVTESLQYQVTKAGRYTVVYYLVDGDYNTARQEYVVVAR